MTEIKGDANDAPLFGFGIGGIPLILLLMVMLGVGLNSLATPREPSSYDGDLRMVIEKSFASAAEADERVRSAPSKGFKIVPQERACRFVNGGWNCQQGYVLAKQDSGVEIKFAIRFQKVGGHWIAFHDITPS